MKNRRGDYQDEPELAELYDTILSYTERPDRAFYVECCRETEGDVLELASGTGRIMIPVARAGCNVTGLEISEHMLNRCRQKLMAEPPSVRARARPLQGDMRSFSIERVFQLAVIPAHSFQHLVTVDDQMACLGAIRHHLSPGGRLVFDVYQVDFAQITQPNHDGEVEDMPQFELPDGRKLRSACRVAAHHRAEQFRDVELIHYLTDRDGTERRLVHAFPYRYFFRYEIEHLLTRCGFRTVTVYGDFQGKSLVDDSPEMIFVAEKV